MALYQVNAGDRILAADSVQFYNILKGVAASGENILLIYNAGALTFQPSSDPAAGTRVLTIKNNAGTTLFSARYDGLLELLAAAAAPTSPVAGSAYFDTLLKFLRVHDGTNWVNPSDSPQPNLVLNSDFSRRTVFGLAMPEVFADTSGATAVDGSLGAVASNVLTAGTNGTWSIKWCGTNATFYRDGTFSYLVKQNGTGTTNVGRIGGGRNDGAAWLTNNGVYATYYRTALNTVTLELIKVVAGVVTVIASQAGVTWTDGRVGWAELSAQGTTYIARFYDQGSATPGVKASATRLDNGTITGTASDSALTSGQPAAVNGSGVGAATVWGGIATGNGGVYVETWLPESWTTSMVGTLGGQAIGFDESADSGPLSKQWALRAYIPAASRRIQVYADTQDGSVAASTAHAYSVYMKTSGKGGSGTLIPLTVTTETSALAVVDTDNLNDSGETSWTRKTATRTAGATARRARLTFDINSGATATGTAFFMLAQIEQGSAVTGWRSAPADDAPIVWNKTLAGSAVISTTSGTMVEVDPRDLAGNFFVPWDATLDIRFDAVGYNGTINDDIATGLTVAGAALGSASANLTQVRMGVATIPTLVGCARVTTVAAGKTRIAATFCQAVGGTASLWTIDRVLRITATRGK